MKTTNEAVQPRKGKTYYPILKTREEADVFLGNFYKYKDAFPAIVEQVNVKAMRGTPEEKEMFVGILRNEIQKLSGTVQSTLSYARNHADDGLSLLAQNQEAMDALKQVKTDICNLGKAVEFAVSQAETTSIFHALAKGIIPSGYAAAPLMESQEDAEPPAPSPDAENVSH